jgi:hypothetical protein
VERSELKSGFESQISLSDELFVQVRRRATASEGPLHQYWDLSAYNSDFPYLLDSLLHLDVEFKE